MGLNKLTFGEHEMPCYETLVQRDENGRRNVMSGSSFTIEGLDEMQQKSH